MNWIRTISAMIMGISYASGIAQPVLTVANTPQPNWTYVFRSGNWTGIPISTDGADLTWDYSAVAVEDDAIEISYTSNPAFNSFPGACYYDQPSYLDTTLLRTKDYIYKVTDTSLVLAFAKLRGSSVNSICVKQVDLTLLRFPFSLMDSIRGSWNYDSEHGGMLVTASAYGTLILPDTTYENCLLLHTKSNYTPHGADTHNGHIHSKMYFFDRYEWYTENAQVPLLGVYQRVDLDVYYMGNTATFHTSALVYRDQNDTTQIEVNARANRPSVYPNPTNGKVEIRPDLKFDQITIIDMRGAAVRTVPSSATYIDLGDLSAGIYIIQIISANSVMTQRLIKQ